MDIDVIIGAGISSSACAKHLMSAGKSFLILEAAQRGFSMHASMGMAKGAVDGLMRSLAAELAPKIRMNAISPSVTKTPLSEKILSNEQVAESIKNKHPLKRLGTPEDIAKLAAFLISERSEWITGQFIGVDGGRSTIEITG